MLNIEQYKTSFFDCDGVILDSNQIKTDGFRYALGDENPELVEMFIAYHKANGGVSRYVKFAYFYQELKKAENAEELAKEAIDRYAGYCRSELIRCNEIPGVRNVLEILKSAGVKSYVVSGGDEKELNEVFHERGLDKYFVEVLGSPKTKKEHLKRIESEGSLVKPAVYFGDAKSDYEAAKGFGIEFVFVSGASDWYDGVHVCNEKMKLSILNFTEILLMD